MHVLIAGPTTAKPFLDALASAVRTDTVRVQCRYDLLRPSDYEGWADVDILVPFALPCSDADMAGAPRLRAVIVPSLGFEGVDVESAMRRKLAVANGRIAENFESVAEAAVLFMLMSLYDIHAVEARLRSGVARTGPPTARMLKGKIIGLIGYGNIAKAVAARLSGWGVQILVTTRRPVSADVGSFIQQCDFDTLLDRSDIVLPLVPLTVDTRHMLSKAELLRMKRGAILINLSRGEVVDEHALHDPEVTSHLGAIALDVFEIEPLPMHSPLRNRPATILTGHEISHTQENLNALLDTAVANVQNAIAGRALLTPLG